MSEFHNDINPATLWRDIQQQASGDAEREPLLRDALCEHIIDRDSFAQSLASVLASKIAESVEQRSAWREAFEQLFAAQPTIVAAALRDLSCQLQSNAAIRGLYTPLLYFGGYHALQCYRIAHCYWHGDRSALANYIQGRAISLFGVDIHPGAKIGSAIFMDHAVGIVIGETAIVEDEVTIFQSVTLGGTGKGTGKRHPTVRRGAFIGSCAVVLGDIEIGEGAKVGAGAVVVKDLAAHNTAIGPCADVLVSRGSAQQGATTKSTEE
ncbi:MAG: serine O-acetyltransferase EpsC [Pseudomonadales bacterium]